MRTNVINSGNSLNCFQFLLIRQAVNMSSCLKRNLPFLQLLHESKNNRQKRALLNHITADQIRAFDEICNHILRGHCKLDNQSRLLLRKNINTLKKISSRNITNSAKKKIINQKGGGFGKIFPIVLKAILKSKDFIVNHKKAFETAATDAEALAL